VSKNQSDYDIPPNKYNFHVDLKFGKKGEALVESFLQALSGGAFEVKTDRYRNGRMVVEIMQHPRRKMRPDGTEHWQPSGLMVTKATGGYTYSHWMAGKARSQSCQCHD
jgi:hypothetical protein